MPGARFLHSVLMQDEAQAADGVVTKDLPINPMSFILLTIKARNETATIGNFSPLNALLDMITKIEVLYKGTAVYSANARDTFVLNVLLGFKPIQLNTDDLNDEVRAITLMVPLGRYPYFPGECFPGTKKGELQLQLTTDVLVTGMEDLILQVETVELFDAKPEHFLKMTTGTKTPSAAQEEDTELPIGNLLAGVLIFQTTITLATAWASVLVGVDFLKFLIDNQEWGYSKTNWESLFGYLANKKLGTPYNNHIHRENTSSSYAQNADTVVGNDISSMLDNYLFLDFDPLQDGSYLVETAGRSRVHMRINHGNIGALRVMPIELVKPSQIGL